MISRPSTAVVVSASRSSLARARLRFFRLRASALCFAATPMLTMDPSSQPYSSP